MIAATLSENRFKFISHFIASDDKPTRANHWKTDKRKLFESMNDRNTKTR